MPTKILREDRHIDALAVLLRAIDPPITVSWTKGDPRSGAQNRLAQRWFSDIARQSGDRTHEDVRADCKLRHGVPILRDGNEAFCASYDRVLMHLGHEEKLAAIKAFDLPVTRLMTVKQMTAFMDAVHAEFAALGVRLTDPDALKYETEFGAEVLA